MVPPFTMDLALLIVTATLLGFVARKTKQPTIVGYILTGLVLGPVFLNVATGAELTEFMSKLGLGFLLFLLGIEMNLKDIEGLVKPITSIAVWQTVLQTSLAFIIPLALGFTVMETVVIALCTVFGATPVIVKLLADKGEISSLPGKINVGVLILQDIYLVIILALFSADTLTNVSAIGFALVKIFALIGVIGLVSYLSSQYVLPGLFRLVANNDHAFFVHGIAWAFLFISLSLQLDLSVEVGAFLAGLGLGQMPYRNELKERVRPLTNFFMVIFFSSIALTLEPSNLVAYWERAVVASIGLMVGNFLIMFYLIKRLDFDIETSFIGSINMTQVSEFSLVVGALAVTQGYIGHDILGYLSVMALLTMTTSSYLINYNQQIYQWVEPYLTRYLSEGDPRSFDPLHDHAIVLGYTTVSRELLPELEQHFDDIIVVEKDASVATELAESPYEFIYGDFHHKELQHSANLGSASLLLSLSPDLKLNRKLVGSTGSTVIVRARSFKDAVELYDDGADYVIVKDYLVAEELCDIVETHLPRADADTVEHQEGDR